MECRRCDVHCDKVVYPGACLARSCPFVYSYEAWGHTYVGCMQKIYEVEIDLDMLTAAERRQAGFGAIRAMRQPLPMCKAEVEQPTRPAARTPGASTRSSVSCRSGARPSACSLSRERARRAAAPRAGGEPPAPRANRGRRAAPPGRRRRARRRPRCRSSARRRRGRAAARRRAHDGRRGRSRDPEADRRLLGRADGRGAGDLAPSDLGRQSVDVPLRRVRRGEGAPGPESRPQPAQEPVRRVDLRLQILDRDVGRHDRAEARQPPDRRLDARDGNLQHEARRARPRAGVDLHRLQVAAERVRDRECLVRGGRHRARARHLELSEAE